MTIMAALHRALIEDESAHHEPRITRIRVTTDAIPGSVVALPMTPERARLVGRPGPLPHEILVHPEDWFGILVGASTFGPGWLASAGLPNRVLGLPVEHTWP